MLLPKFLLPSLAFANYVLYPRPVMMANLGRPLNPHLRAKQKRLRDKKSPKIKRNSRR